ncbi:protein FAR1-RELATED SEQUENCE 9-like [Carex rostrata]
MENARTEADELIDEDYVQCLMSLDTNARASETDHSILSEPPADGPPQNLANDTNRISVSIVKETEATIKEPKEPELGMAFESDEAAKGFYNEYARRLGFPFRVGRSRRSKGAEEVVIMKRFVCSKEGVYRKKQSGEEGMRKRERNSMREGCKAMMEVIRDAPSRWVISKLEKTHNHRLGASNRVGYLRARGTFTDAASASSDSKPNVPDFSNPDYSTFLHQNLFGEGGDVQVLLDYFRKKQSENPDFFYALQVDNSSCVTNALWADARSRAAYRYFGDAVTFDTTYKKNKYMMPVVVFSGLNHHLQPVIFGCALLVEETEFSLVWLFETWLAAMGGRAPVSVITDQNRAVAAAVSKVFPGTHHRLCKWLILSRTKQKLSHLYNSHPTLRAELESCVIESETVNSFEASWVSIIEKYDLRKNSWLQILFNLRQKWVPLYLKETFFGEMLPTQKLETMNDFYKKHFNTRTSLKVFLTQFDLTMASRYEEEVMEDLDSVRRSPALKTASLIEKQAANVYTKAVFSKFQEEFVQSLGYVVQKIRNGGTCKFNVTSDEDSLDTFYVTYNTARKTANCSCKNFEFCGVLCRHIFGVLLIVDPRILPEEYFLKRWSKIAKVDLEPETGCGLVQDSINSRYSDLCIDAVRCGEKGAVTLEMYKDAKEVLQKAYEEIIALEKDANRVVHRDPININEEITIDDAMTDQLQDSERKVTNLLGQLLSSSWSPV